MYRNISPQNAIFVGILLLLMPSRHQATAQVNAAFDPIFTCSLIANGTKIKDPRYCNTYIECVSPRPISRSCGKLFYDRNSGKCVDPQKTLCLSSDPCAAKPNGFVKDPYSCNGYFYCYSGYGTRGECSAGKNYNPETENCRGDYPCKIEMLPEDYCNVIPDGVFIKVSTSCRKYQLCWKSKLLNGTCPVGFYLNAYAGNCDYPKYVDCNEQPAMKPEGVECTKGDVFISDGQTCNGYFYCQSSDDGNFNLIHGFCPENRFFDSRNGGACIGRTEIACPFNRCTALGVKFIQLANINGDGCRGFSICQGGKPIAEAQCPEGEYFDETLQWCTRNVVQYAACRAASGTKVLKT